MNTKRRFNHKKATQALNFFALKEGGEINKMKALKLLWLADRHHLRQFARTITNDEYKAMRRGPVASGTRDLLERSSFLAPLHLEYSSHFIKESGDRNYFHSISGVQDVVFSKTDLNALEEVYSLFGDRDKDYLSEFTHDYPEWKKFEKPLAKGIKSCNIDLQDFFENPDTGNHSLFKESPEELETSKELFLHL